MLLTPGRSIRKRVSVRLMGLVWSSFIEWF